MIDLILTLAFGVAVVGMMVFLVLLAGMLIQPVVDRPVKGLDDLDDALDGAGRDVQPSAGLYQSRAGQRYTGSHRRKSPSRWLARMGRAHHRRPAKEIRRLP